MPVKIPTLSPIYPSVAAQKSAAASQPKFLTQPLKTEKAVYVRQERQKSMAKRIDEVEKWIVDSSAAIKVPPKFSDQMEKLQSEIQGILNRVKDSFVQLGESTNSQKREEAQEDFEKKFEELPNKLGKIRELLLNSCAESGDTKSQETQKNIEEQHSSILKFLEILFVFCCVTMRLERVMSLLQGETTNHQEAQQNSLPASDQSQQTNEPFEVEAIASIWERVDKFGATLSPEFDRQHLQHQLNEIRSQLAALQRGETNNAQQTQTVSVSVPSIVVSPASTSASTQTNPISARASSSAASVSVQSAVGDLISRVPTKPVQLKRTPSQSLLATLLEGEEQLSSRKEDSANSSKSISAGGEAETHDEVSGMRVSKLYRGKPIEHLQRELDEILAQLEVSEPDETDSWRRDLPIPSIVASSAFVAAQSNPISVYSTSSSDQSVSEQELVSKPIPVSIDGRPRHAGRSRSDNFLSYVHTEKGPSPTNSFSATVIPGVIAEQDEELNIRAERSIKAARSIISDENILRWQTDIHEIVSSDEEESKRRVSYITRLNEEVIKAWQEMRQAEQELWADPDELANQSLLKASPKADSAFGGSVTRGITSKPARMLWEKRDNLKRAQAKLERRLEALEEACKPVRTNNITPASVANSFKGDITSPRSYVELHVFEAFASQSASQLKRLEQLLTKAEAKIEDLQQEAEERQHEEARRDEIQQQHQQSLNAYGLEQKAQKKTLSSHASQLTLQGEKLALHEEKLKLQGQAITKLRQEVLRQARHVVELEEKLTTLTSGQIQLSERMETVEGEQVIQGQQIELHSQLMAGAETAQGRENNALWQELSLQKKRLAEAFVQLSEAQHKFEEEQRKEVQKVKGGLDKRYEKVEERVSDVETGLELAKANQQRRNQEFDTRIKKLKESTIKKLEESTASSIDELKNELQALDASKFGSKEFAAEKEQLFRKIRADLEYLITEASNSLREELREVEALHEDFRNKNWIPLMHKLSEVVPQMMEQIQEAAQSSALTMDEINREIVALNSVLQEDLDQKITLLEDKLSDELWAKAQTLIADHVDEVATTLREFKGELETQQENVKGLDESVAVALKEHKLRYRTAIGALRNDFSKRVQAVQAEALLELSKVKDQQISKHINTEKFLRKVSEKADQNELGLGILQGQFATQQTDWKKTEIDLKRRVREGKEELEAKIRKALTWEDYKQDQAYFKNTMLGTLDTKVKDFAGELSAPIAGLTEELAQLKDEFNDSDEKWNTLMTDFPLILELNQQAYKKVLIDSHNQLVARLQEIEIAHASQQEDIGVFTMEHEEYGLLSQQIAELQKAVAASQQNKQIALENFGDLETTMLAEIQILLNNLRDEYRKGDYELDEKIKVSREGTEKTVEAMISALEKKQRKAKNIVRKVSRVMQRKFEQDEITLGTFSTSLVNQKKDLEGKLALAKHDWNIDIDNLNDKVDILARDKVGSEELLGMHISRVSKNVDTSQGHQLETYGVGRSSSFNKPSGPSRKSKKEDAVKGA